MATAIVLTTTACYARIGETQAQIETRYGKHVKAVSPVKPATSAYLYRQGDLAFFIGFVDGKAAYELVEAVEEEDGDIGEDEVSAKDIATVLKAETPAGGWTALNADKTGDRHWKSADGKLLAGYDAQHYQLMIESAEFFHARSVGTK